MILALFGFAKLTCWTNIITTCDQIITIIKIVLELLQQRAAKVDLSICLGTKISLQLLPCSKYCSVLCHIPKIRTREYVKLDNLHDTSV